MNCQKQKGLTLRRGFTIIELLVVIAIIVVIVSMLTPALGRAFRSARSAEDTTQAKGIHASMLLYSTTSDGKLPRPSEIGKGYVDASGDSTLIHDIYDTTANLMSFMLAQKYFNTEYLISPTEANPNVQDINEIDLVYDFESIDGETVLWDNAFAADISSATPANLVNNSYAHQALCGERVRLKWHAGASASDIIISNRGPETTITSDGIMSVDENSYTLQFHGADNTWSGVVVGGDGSSRVANSLYPDGVAYKPLNGLPLGPDNIFYTDWNDINISSAPLGMASGDNWLVICNDVYSENEISAVWD
ncbi:MAG: prepilin-type N-terminal cleavage/methylation domain-containing protein [Planctomycetes bacterium]|nr:prepilin-type N-terminal cleavage/methylation domain-containing protein [Planctomycetota bacterium]